MCGRKNSKIGSEVYVLVLRHSSIHASAATNRGNSDTAKRLSRVDLSAVRISGFRKLILKNYSPWNKGKYKNG